MNRARVWARTVVWLAVLAAGCAARPEMAAPPASPGGAEPPESLPSNGGPAMGGSSLREDDEDKEGPRAALAHAKRELDVAERELFASASDCAAACRALASMVRAAAHLCALATQDDDRQRCEEAKRTVQQARERVNATCQTCEGGPSLTPDTTVPSPPK